MTYLAPGATLHSSLVRWPTPMIEEYEGAKLDFFPQRAPLGNADQASDHLSPTPDSLDFTWGNILTSLFPVLLSSLPPRFFPKSFQSNALGVQWCGEMLRYPIPQKKKSYMCTNPYFWIHFFETYLKTLGTRSSPRKLTLKMGLLTRQIVVTFLPWW